jgi:4-diphosphocytidyl-2-C-methyl-D-erythritol kinase
MLTFPNCKINLGLYVTQKRPDGYHNLETLFYPVALTEPLEIVPAAVAAIHITGSSILGEATHNLVWRAYMLLKNDFPNQVGELDIYLHKVLPMGAGLGGGSADAAFMLMLINKYAQLGLSQAQLAAYALQLGSDCPFFIYNKPCYAAGRGELLEEVALDLSNYSLQLICPELHIATATAFSMMTPKAAPINLKNLPEIAIDQWKELLSNDFEMPVFAQHPILAHIKEQLYQGGAVYAAMSGSGSSIYGIFNSKQRANIKADIAFRDIYIDALNPVGHI